MSCLRKSRQKKLKSQQKRKQDDFGTFHTSEFDMPKKGKFRVVFAASARYKDDCLNDQLLQGPEHINSLQGILMRFGNHSVAFCCDVEKCSTTSVSHHKTVIFSDFSG